jgi:hypothetical protein
MHRAEVPEFPSYPTFSEFTWKTYIYQSVALIFCAQAAAPFRGIPESLNQRPVFTTTSA